MTVMIMLLPEAGLCRGLRSASTVMLTFLTSIRFLKGQKLI